MMTADSRGTHAVSGLYCAGAGLRTRHKSATLIINCLATWFVFADVHKQFDLQTAFIKLGSQCMRGGDWSNSFSDCGWAAQTSLALIVIFKQRYLINALTFPVSILPAAFVLLRAGIFN